MRRTTTSLLRAWVELFATAGKWPEVIAVYHGLMAARSSDDEVAALADARHQRDRVRPSRRCSR